MSATIIALANQKGGVAKTTSTHNIGAALANKGKKVLLIDLDSQASLTISVGLEPEEYPNTIASLLKENKPNINEYVYKLETNPKLDIIPSIIDLAVVEAELVVAMAKEYILGRALKPVKENYDCILIDCPPQLSVLTLNGLSCADYVLIPVKTDYLSYRAVEHLEDAIAGVKEKVNPKLQSLGVIATFCESNTKSTKEVLDLIDQKYKRIGTINKTVKITEGISTGEAIVDKHPETAVAQEYNKIADYIIGGNY